MEDRELITYEVRTWVPKEHCFCKTGLRLQEYPGHCPGETVPFCPHKSAYSNGKYYNKKTRNNLDASVVMSEKLASSCGPGPLLQQKGTNWLDG